MRVAVFSTKPYDREFLDRANESHNHELVYYEPRLTKDTIRLAEGFDCICAFVNDELNATVLNALAEQGTRLIALRAAGFNNVDLATARDLGITVVRVPAYSPYAVAEHTLALILTLNRHVHRSYTRVRDGNFSLAGLMGFDLNGRTCGLIGTGKIGVITARILRGFGCDVLAYDPYPNADYEADGTLTYVELDDLFAQSDIISLHCPLTPDTYHILDAEALEKTKKGVMIINTSRGALIDASAMIDGLKSGQVGYLGLDVYEEEADLFFEDLSSIMIQDDIFARLLTIPNVVITGHQGYFTQEALSNIAETTVKNISDFATTGASENALDLDKLIKGS